MYTSQVWVLNFLIKHIKYIKVNGHMPGNREISTAVPQGCVLSTVHYTIDTNDIGSLTVHIPIIQFVDKKTTLALWQVRRVCTILLLIISTNMNSE